MYYCISRTHSIKCSIFKQKNWRKLSFKKIYENKLAFLFVLNYLSSSINPTLTHGQPTPVRREKELEAVHGAVQRQGLGTEHSQDDVGEHGREPKNLKRNEGYFILPYLVFSK